MLNKKFGLLYVLNLVLITALVLAACAQASPALPATKVPDPIQAPVTAKVPVPTATAAPAASAVPTTAPTAPPTSKIPMVVANSLTPNDETQARLRVSQCVPNEPDMHIVVNGKVLESSGVPMGYLEAGSMSRYEYLLPGTYRVAVVPSEKGMDQAFLAPLDVTLSAGHRYTLVVFGQPDEKDHPGLLIDETEAYQKAGSNPNSASHITINNVKGAATLSFLQDGMGEKDVPYGGFAASVLPEKFKGFNIEINGATVEINGSGAN